MCKFPVSPYNTRVSADIPSWHGDVKPENILSVGDRFKIADPGEAKMVKAEPGKIPSTKVPGGTRSFGKQSLLL